MSDEIGVQLVHSLNKKHSLVSGRAGLEEVNFFAYLMLYYTNGVEAARALGMSVVFQQIAFTPSITPHLPHMEGGHHGGGR
jgi:hypothetical protein